MLRAEVLELGEDVAAIDEQHASAVHDEPDEHVVDARRARTQRKPNPEIPVAELVQLLVESAEAPHELRSREDVGAASPDDVPAEHGPCERAGIRRLVTVRKRSSSSTQTAPA